MRSDLQMGKQGQQQNILLIVAIFSYLPAKAAFSF